jgi:hypothetical protein
VRRAAGAASAEIPVEHVATAPKRGKRGSRRRGAGCSGFGDAVGTPLQASPRDRGRLTSVWPKNTRPTRRPPRTPLTRLVAKGISIGQSGSKARSPSAERFIQAVRGRAVVGVFPRDQPVTSSLPSSLGRWWFLERSQRVASPVPAPGRWAAYGRALSATPNAPLQRRLVAR